MRLKLLRPARKSASLMLWVVAVSAPTSTVDPGANNTPLGLLRTTWPLALIWPKIWLGALPSTRLSITLLAEGWLMFTLAWAPTSKLCQLTAANGLLWVMFITAPAWLMVARPAAT